MDFQAFQEAPLPESCCLNFTSSNITRLDWGALVGVRGLRELYLSHCSITDISNARGVPPALEILHLSHNLLESLPGSFLEDAPNLRVLYLDSNQLQELPHSFLKASTQVQEVYLGFNALTFLPASLLKPSLLQLQLSNNSWDCSCALLSNLEGWPSMAAEVVCHTPEQYHGVDLQSIPREELCRSHSLTALFISRWHLTRTCCSPACREEDLGAGKGTDPAYVVYGGCHTWTGCPGHLGLGNRSLGWPCLLPTPHPAMSHHVAQGLETAGAHVLLHTLGARVGVRGAHTHREALEGAPCRFLCLMYRQAL
uniref:Uncharacterized protein n=1 Tax=Buteo japonicus TaxID=224669 RepID=A0A8C0AQ09_9AVES